MNVAIVLCFFFGFGGVMVSFFNKNFRCVGVFWCMGINKSRTKRGSGNECLYDMQWRN